MFFSYCDDCLATGKYDQDQMHSLKKKTFRELRAETDKRMALLRRDNPYVYEMWSCRWHNKMTNHKKDHPLAYKHQHEPTGGPDIIKPKLTEQEIVQFIHNGRLEGFVRGNIEVPEELRDDNKLVNWPPILSRRKVNAKELDLHSQDYAEWHGLMKTPRHPVVQGFSAEGVVLTTLQARYLLEMGCVLSEIDVVIQYRFGVPFKEFRAWCERGRQAAAVSGNKIIDAFLKAIGK